MEIHRAPIRLEDAGQNAQQGGFSAAVASYQSHDLSLLDLKRDAVQRLKVLHTSGALSGRRAGLLLPPGDGDDAAVAQMNIFCRDRCGALGGIHFTHVQFLLNIK